MSDPILLLAQGPVYTDLNGRSVFDVLEAIRALPNRERFFVAYSLWRDTPDDLIRKIAALTDQIVLTDRPTEPGAANRNLQAQGVSAGLNAMRERNFRYTVKTRSDIILSAEFARRVVEMADSGSEKLLVTNLFTRLEPFHLSDMIVASTTENIAHFFRPVAAHYEDLFSPEVQFCRVFVRSKGLKYTMRLGDYFRFLRDWVELTDFNEMRLQWLKEPNIQIKKLNQVNRILEDRDCGPVLTRLLTPRFHRFLQNTRLPAGLLACLLLQQDAAMRLACYYTPFFRWAGYPLQYGTPEYALPLVEAPRCSAAQGATGASADR